MRLEEDAELHALVNGRTLSTWSSRGWQRLSLLVVAVLAVLGGALLGVRLHPDKPEKTTAAIQDAASMVDIDAKAQHLWTPHFLVAYPHAVCNDGTPAAYYYREGAPKVGKWLVFLEGAGWCWDVESCSGGWHEKVGTSSNFPRTPQKIVMWSKSLLGMFNLTEGNPIKDFNIVFVRTCSNDAFMGNRGPVDHIRPGLSWHFRGAAIIEAVYEDLRAHYGLGDSSDHHVVFGGCSSGARGAMVSLDYVAANLVGNASLAGLLDSPIWVPIEPLAPNVVSFEDQTSSFMNFTNATTFVRSDCNAAYANGTNGTDRWKCIMGGYLLPFINTPYFVSHSQYDLFSVSVNALGHFAPFVQLNETQLTYAGTYRKMLLDYLPNPKDDSGITIYSSACYNHCSFLSHEFYTIRADGISLLDVLRQWLESQGGQMTTGYIVDRCKGFNCGHDELALDAGPADWQARSNAASIGAYLFSFVLSALAGLC